MARINERTDIVTVLQVMQPEKTLTGRYFCITGHLSKPRSEIEELIRNSGGLVSKTVDYGVTLVTNEDWTRGTVDGASSKYKKARKLSSKIISEQQLLDIISGISG